MNKIVKILEVTIILFIASCNNPFNESTTPTDLSDYFPLKTGNKWYYSYGYSSGNSMNGIIKKGSLIWEVVGIKKINRETSEFKIQTLNTGIDISHTYEATQQPPDQYDTTSYKDIENSFIIISKKDTLFVKTDSEYVSFPLIDFIPFCRYNDPDIVGDTMKIDMQSDWGGYQKLKINTGLIEYQYNTGLLGNYTYRNITLDSVHLK